jgi:hypothetical protein
MTPIEQTSRAGRGRLDARVANTNVAILARLDAVSAAQQHTAVIG